MQSVYDRLNRRLEDKAGNGQKRWGLKWISADEFAENEKQRKAAEQEMNLKQRDLQRASASWTTPPPSWKKRKPGDRKARWFCCGSRRAFDTAQRRFDAALKEYQKLADSVPHPSPTVLATVPMDDAAGSTSDPTKLASAAGDNHRQ